ncbi:DUF6525 family protein [Aliiroseovarius sp. Z3]|uniref:DUF6525 family protein n=1 Tax=Aliiroseovarius sp. Z3 TaxID=2811402 RepID=UPI0023B33508|nr:DUF6525 family protein [Aliiroseovarius sp. Z3]
MSGNRGKTSLKCKRRSTCSMREYDRLPPELRKWLATAILPWGPRSVHRAYDRAVARTRDKTRALQELDRIQNGLVAKDARKVWEQEHPGGLGQTQP